MRHWARRRSPQHGGSPIRPRSHSPSAVLSDLGSTAAWWPAQGLPALFPVARTRRRLPFNSAEVSSVGTLMIVRLSRRWHRPAGVQLVGAHQAWVVSHHAGPLGGPKMGAGACHIELPPLQPQRPALSYSPYGCRRAQLDSRQPGLILRGTHHACSQCLSAGERTCFQELPQRSLVASRTLACRSPPPPASGNKFAVTDNPDVPGCTNQTRDSHTKPGAQLFHSMTIACCRQRLPQRPDQPAACCQPCR